jgi:hypothetical protein
MKPRFLRKIRYMLKGLGKIRFTKNFSDLGHEPEIGSIRKFLNPKTSPKKLSYDPVARWHMSHPRYQFLQNQDGKILDIGCGDGGLGNYLEWPKKMKNIQLLGCDLKDSNKPPKGYTQYLGGGYQKIESLEGVTAITAIHVIEHLPNLVEFFTFLSKSQGGTHLYLEWPTIESCSFPTIKDIQESILNGNLIETSNYFDDNTHIPPRPPSLPEVKTLLQSFGFCINTAIRFQRKTDVDYVSEMIRAGDRGGVTMAYWENFGFAYSLSATRLIEKN